MDIRNRRREYEKESAYSYFVPNVGVSKASSMGKKEIGATPFGGEVEEGWRRRWVAMK